MGYVAAATSPRRGLLHKAFSHCCHIYVAHAISHSQRSGKLAADQL
jgi:hypothetical protein